MSSPHASGPSKLALAWTNVKGLVHDHALLAVLELQRAGISLVKMVAAGIIISILRRFGVDGSRRCGRRVGGRRRCELGRCAGRAAIVNIVVAVAIAFWGKSQVPDLLFAATLRQLRQDVLHPEKEHAPNRSVG